MLKDRKYVNKELLTYIDFYVYELEDLIRCYKEDVYLKLTNLKAHFEVMSTLPKIKAYRESERFKERPFTNPYVCNWG